MKAYQKSENQKFKSNFMTNFQNSKFVKVQSHKNQV